MKTKLKSLIWSITLVVAGWTATGFAAETTSKADKIANDDADFVNEVALGGMMEVQLGKAAQDHASKSQVKEFGRRMQTDHSKANDELKKIATKKDIKLPTDLAG